jgi:predicted transcriptional regulator
VGYELSELFSDAFGEDVNKLNLRWAVIGKSMISNVTGGVITGHHVAHNYVIGSLNICTSQEESPEFLRGKQRAKMDAIQPRKYSKPLRLRMKLI